MNVPEPPDISQYVAYTVKQNGKIVLTTTDKQQAENFAKSVAGIVEEIQATDPNAVSEEVTQ